MWAIMTETYNEEKEERIKKLKENKEKARKQKEQNKTRKKEEKRIEYNINIDKLRNYEYRQELKERKEKRAKSLNSLYKDINEKNIELNIRRKEIYLEEDIGKMLNKILDKRRLKIDMSGLI